MFVSHLSKTFLGILRKMGIKLVNALMLLCVLLSNFTGIVQARAESREVSGSDAQGNPSATDDVYAPPSFTHPEARQVNKPGTSSDTIVQAGDNSANFSDIESTSYSSPTNITLGVPLGYWKFDEGSGAIAVDQGSGLHNGATNGTVEWVNGRYYDPTLQPPDYALQFNGTDSYVSVLDDFDPTAYTIAVWVKPTAINRNIFVRTTSSGPTSSSSHNIYINSSGYFCAYTSAGGAKTVCGTTKVNTITPMWYHVASTAANSGQLKLYVNGVQEGTPVNIGTLWTGGDRYYIGSNRAGGAGIFCGGYG